MAKEVTVTFKVSENKTTYSFNGEKEVDITGGTIEDRLYKLIKFIHETNIVMEATDMSKWEQVS